MGTRFGHYTELKPKSFVEFKGKSMIVRSIETLLSCGINRIIIGTGYLSEAFETLKGIYPQIETCFSPRYAETNSMYTLYNMKECIGDDDFILLESDLIYEKRAILSLLECQQKDVLLMSPLTKFQDQYYVDYDEDHILKACSVHKEDLNVKGEFVGIHKISNEFYKQMCGDYGTICEVQPKLGYEYELIRMSRAILPLYVLKIDDLKWYEIDDENDLLYAENNILL